MAKWITDRLELARDSFNGERLVVLSPDSRVRPRRLVVLVHGLGGSGFGTWGRHTRRLLESSSLASDLAVLDYPSAWRDVKNQPRLRDVVEGLVAELQALEYTSVVLVGHSMGGIVLAWSLRLWGESLAAPSPISRIAGAVYVASPRLGSRWPSPPREHRVLKIHGDVQADNERFFTTRVDVSIERNNAAPIKVPSFAARGDTDRLVGAFSSSVGIPADQRIPLPGSHRRVMKTATFDAWLERRLSQLFDLHAQPLPARPGDILTTQFMGDSSRPEWDDAYDRALQRFIDVNRLPVRHAYRGEVPVGLRMRVVTAEAILSGACVPDVLQDTEDHRAERIRALGVAAYGAGDGAVGVLRTAVGSADQRWLEQAASNAELESKMTSWLDRVARNPILERRHQQAIRRDLGVDKGLL